MSEEGQNLLSMVQAIRKFCKELSELLGTADKLMGKEDWVSQRQMKAFYETSQDLYSYQRWFPNEIQRFYKNDSYPDILAFISVLLDDREKKYEQFEEPLLTAGWFDYGKGNEVPNNWEYWFARFHGYMPNRKDDGTLFNKDPQENWPWPEDKTPYKFKTVNTFGWPLVTITNTEELKAKITNPLIYHIEKPFE